MSNGALAGCHALERFWLPGPFQTGSKQGAYIRCSQMGCITHGDGVRAILGYFWSLCLIVKHFFDS